MENTNRKNTEKNPEEEGVVKKFSGIKRKRQIERKGGKGSEKIEKIPIFKPMTLLEHQT